MSLIELINSNDLSESKIAEQIIDELEYTHNDRVIELAIGFLEHKNAAMRAAALNVITECSNSWPLEAEFAEAALACLADRDARVRRAAIRLAAETVSSCEQALGDLIHCLADPDEDNREAAFRVLVEIGRSLNRESCFLLAEYLRHEDKAVRSRARQILMEQGQEDLVRGYDGSASENANMEA